MNEATTFVNGFNTSDSQEQKLRSVGDDTNVTFDWYTSYPQNSTANDTYFLPFIPSIEKFNNSSLNFDNMTLALNATHLLSGYREYDVHNLNGFLETMRTWNILND